MVEFNIRTDTEDFEKNMKLEGCPSELQYNIKEAVTDYWGGIL